jgi:Domain of unknown function (DUF1772)
MKHDVVLALRDVAILLTGLVAGGQAMLWWAVLPGQRRLSALESLHFHQSTLSPDLPDHYIQPAGILSMAAGAALLGLGPGSTADTALAAAGIAAIAVIAVITRIVNRPINRGVATWSDAQAVDYPAVRARWQRGHALRTSFGLAAFAAYIVLASH